VPGDAHAGARRKWACYSAKSAATRRNAVARRKAPADKSVARHQGKDSAIAFNFSHCQSLILQGILEGLRLRADKIAAIEKVPNVEFPVSGVSLDLVPWHGALEVSLRLCT
jgi:hypothetical protein